jgi:hypothetical protein
MKLLLVWLGLVTFFSLFGIIGGIAANCDIRLGVFAGIVFGVVVATIVFILLFISVKVDENTWNNGVCPTCGQAWEFKCVTQGAGNNHSYYYECKNCKTIIEQCILR